MANGTQPVVKISGYLEKKAKLRIGSPWKKYWFVLEGRLLLYYRSKDEYETLSPCKGSINLCPPCNVKPALSAAGVFQIECRASTVTLRAASRPEQERWMQALLAAIAQSKSNPNRMSHFRYSLDDLPVSTSKNKKTEKSLSRQNTMPFRISSSPKRDQKDIIGRLQQMGAQSYGGSLGAITKLANREHKMQTPKNSPSVSANHSNSSLYATQDLADDNQKSRSATPTDKQHFKLSHNSQSVERIQSVFIENDQYSTIQEENSIDLSLDERALKSANAERIKSLMIDNEQYMMQDMVKASDINANQPNKENVTSFMIENDQYSLPKEETESYFIRNKEIQKIEHLYERISADSTLSEFNHEHKNNNKGSFRKIKHITSNLYERISSGSSNSDTQTKINEQYSIVQKDSKERSKESIELQKTQENEYSIPMNFENTDHNKNNLIIDDQYIPTADDKSNDHLYSDGLIYAPEYLEYAVIDKTKEQEGFYEDPDKLKTHAVYQVIEPTLPPRPELKKTESSEETVSQTSSNEGKKTKKSRFKILHLGKSEKKSEARPEAEKAKPKRRSTSFMRRMWRRKAKSLDSEDDVSCESVDYEIVENKMAKDKNDIQMLQELQKILETRKNMLQEKLNSGGDNTKSVESKVQPIVEEREESLEIRTVEAVKEERPSLPPRQNSQQSLSPYHDVPQNNKAVWESTEANNSESNSNDDHKVCNNDQIDTKIKTIDEILADLDKEKDIQASRQKVRELIEKFNDINDEEVVLRKKTKLELCKSQSDTTVQLKTHNLYDKRESDELTQLLEELTKVTCAPVLTPGVTTSLTTPVLTDDEWLQLIPIRRRRMSDPDYDVPRPHRSLQLHGRTKEAPDNPIPATRFFGPILPPSSTNDNMINTDFSSLTSMDPDSLELENLPSTITNNENYSAKQAEKDRSVSSYTSHDYIKDDKIVYAHPKAIMLSTKFNNSKDNNIYSNLNFDNHQKNNVEIKENINNIELNVRTIEISEELVPILTKSEETFIDSLEPLAEISTAF